MSAVPVDFKLLRDRVQLVTSAQSLAQAMPIPTHSQTDSELPAGGGTTGQCGLDHIWGSLPHLGHGVLRASEF